MQVMINAAMIAPAMIFPEFLYAYTKIKLVKSATGVAIIKNINVKKLLVTIPKPIMYVYRNNTWFKNPKRPVFSKPFGLFCSFT